LEDCSNKYGLSNLRRSSRIAGHINQLSQQRWGLNSRQRFTVDEDDGDSNDDEIGSGEDKGNDNMGGDFDGSNEDFGEDSDGFEMPIAEASQAGISVWDLLGEGFMKEVSQLGMYIVIIMCIILTSLQTKC
jgi:hypothetical protein